MIEKFPVMERAEWLARRSLDLTASDIGAAIGRDRFKTPLALYAEKTGDLMPAADNAAMRRGRWLESAVLSALRDEHPDWEIRPVGLYYRDPSLRLGATPDFVGLTDQPGVTNIQAKVVSRPIFDRDWSDGPPMSYVLQTLTETMLMDAQQGLVAALVIDTYSADLQTFPVPRHAGAEAKVREIAADFWKNVATGKRPAVDASRDAELIEAMYPLPTVPDALDLSRDNMAAALLPEWYALKTGMAIDKKRLGEIETEIKAKLGDHERATLPGWAISWKAQTRAEHVVKASTFRVLRISEIDEEEQERAA